MNERIYLTAGAQHFNVLSLELLPVQKGWVVDRGTPLRRSS